MTSIYCHIDRKITLWEDMRGGRERCTGGCGDVFPCRHDCTHVDCIAARAELAAAKAARKGRAS